MKDSLNKQIVPLLLFLVLLAGCGLYFKTYRWNGVSPGMNEQDILGLLGHPSFVQTVGPMQAWHYGGENEAQAVKKKEYYVVWFQDGQVVRWGKEEEERVPPEQAG